NTDSFIRSADLPHIFEAFYTSNPDAGSGLGLAIAQKIMHDHGGSIHCTSSEEAGTEFWIALPVAYTTPKAVVMPVNLPTRPSDLQTLDAYSNADSPTQLVPVVHEVTAELIR